MTNLQWTFAVVCLFIVAGLVFWKFNKDLRDALFVIVVVIVVALLAFSISGCTTTSDRAAYMKIGVAYELFDRPTFDSRLPCNVEVGKPVNRWFGQPADAITAGYKHMSECSRMDDSNTFDGPFIDFKFKLGRVRD